MLRYLWGAPTADDLRDPVYHVLLAAMWAVALVWFWSFTPWFPTG